MKTSIFYFQVQQNLRNLTVQKVPFPPALPGLTCWATFVERRLSSDVCPARCQNPRRRTVSAHCLAPEHQEITVFVFRCVMGLKWYFPNFSWGLEGFCWNKNIGMGESGFCVLFFVFVWCIVSSAFQSPNRLRKQWSVKIQESAEWREVESL